MQYERFPRDRMYLHDIFLFCLHLRFSEWIIVQTSDVKRHGCHDFSVFVYFFHETDDFDCRSVLVCDTVVDGHL